MPTNRDQHDPLNYRFPRSRYEVYGSPVIEHYRKPRNTKRWLIFIVAIACYALIWKLL